MSGFVTAVASMNRNARRYFAMYALSMGGYFGISGVLLNLYLIRLGFGAAFVGMINGLSLAATAIMSTPSGALGRRFGTRATMLVGLFLSTIGNAVVPAAGSLPQPLVAAGIVGGSLFHFAGGALFAANWTPYFMEIIDEKDRSRLFALRSAVQPAATLAGSLVGGVLPRAVSSLVARPLSDPLPYRLALGAVPLLMLAAFVAMRGTDRLPPRRPSMPGQSTSGSLPLALILPLAAVGMLRQGSVWVARSFYNVYLDRDLRVSTALIGAVAAIGQLGAVPAALLMPASVRRWGKAVTVVLATLGMVAGLLLLGCVRHWIGVAAGFGIMMAAYTVGFSAFELFQQELVAAEWRPVVASACLMGNMIGSSIMVLSSGFLVARLGFTGIFLIGAGASCASALLFAAVFARRERRRAGAGGRPVLE